MLWRRFVKWVAAAVIVGSTAAVTLAQLNLPKDYWVTKPQVLYAAVIALALAALNQARFYAASPARIRAYEQNVRGTLDTGLQAIRNSTGVEFDQVGIHFFRIGGVLGRRMVNIGSLRIKPEPSMIDPIWTKGKGVVGQAWKQDHFLAVDWEDCFDRWNLLGRQSFKKLPKDQRYYLSWGMLQNTRGYKRISASPVRNSSGKVIGCVAVDTPASQAAMANASLAQALHDMSIAVSGLGRPPIGWADGWTR